MSSPDATLEDDIGTPMIGGSNSSIKDIIGGTETSIAGALGDPVSGGSGLSALIKGADVSDVNNQNNLSDLDFSGFNNATNIYGQLNAFINIFNSGTYMIPQGSYSSLKDILNALQINS